MTTRKISAGDVFFVTPGTGSFYPGYHIEVTSITNSMVHYTYLDSSHTGPFSKSLDTFTKFRDRGVIVWARNTKDGSGTAPMPPAAAVGDTFHVHAIRGATYGFATHESLLTVTEVSVTGDVVRYHYANDTKTTYTKSYTTWQRALQGGVLTKMAPTSEPVAPPQPINAAAIMQEGLQAMVDRAKTRDSTKTGERSMKRAVDAFNSLEGTTMTETQGWRFMAVLKLARSVEGSFHVDDYVDGAAYMALAGESARNDKKVV